MNSKKIYLIIFIFFAFIILIGLGLFFYLQNNNYSLKDLKKLTTEKEINEKKINKQNFYAPVLLYHHIANKTPQDPYYVSPEVFAEQMKWLKDNNYNVISSDKLYDVIVNDGTLPEKPVVITFDDSLLDTYQNAYPVLKYYKYPATFFVKMNNISDKALSWQKILEMSDNGMTIGSHTVNHDALTALDNETLLKELTDSKKTIEEHIGKEVNFLAYPGGAYDNRVITASKKAGYKMAFVTRHLVVQKIINENDLYQIPRIHIDDEMPSFINWIQGINLK